MSITLNQADLRTVTTVSASADFTADRLWLNGQEEDVALYSLKWILEHAATGRAMPRRQEMPQEAVLSRERIEAIWNAAPEHVRSARRRWRRERGWAGREGRAEREVRAAA